MLLSAAVIQVSMHGINERAVYSINRRRAEAQTSALNNPASRRTKPSIVNESLIYKQH